MHETDVGFFFQIPVLIFHTCKRNWHADQSSKNHLARLTYTVIQNFYRDYFVIFKH